jgi:hypothetical protein
VVESPLLLEVLLLSLFTDAVVVAFSDDDDELADDELMMKTMKLGSW